MSTQENPEVSLIMPARDTPLPAFQRIVASIRHQTYGLENFELIVVVHNSERSFEHMVHETFDADPTVRIIELHDDLQTASAPRNAGLAAARGEFIMFLDSDDELFPNYVSTALEGIRESGADIACFGYDHVADDESAAGMAQLFHILQEGPTKGMLLRKGDPRLPLFLALPDSFIWSNIFQREFLSENGIHFDEAVAIGEDFVFIHGTALCITWRKS